MSPTCQRKFRSKNDSCLTHINVGERRNTDSSVMLNIKPETVCHVIFRDRQLQGGVPATSNDDDAWEPPKDPTDVENLDLDGGGDDPAPDPAYDELVTFIGELPDDHQCELIALAWLGRGDASHEEWESLVELARERRTGHTHEYLLGMPLLSDYLVEALALFDIACEDFEDEHK